MSHPAGPAPDGHQLPPSPTPALAAAPTETTTVPASDIANDQSQLWLGHDGAHWAGTFAATAAYLLNDILSDGDGDGSGSVEVTCYLHHPADDNLVVRLHGTAVAVLYEHPDAAIVFADGARAPLTELLAVAL